MYVLSSLCYICIMISCVLISRIVECLLCCVRWFNMCVVWCVCMVDMFCSGFVLVCVCLVLSLLRVIVGVCVSMMLWLFCVFWVVLWVGNV